MVAKKPTKKATVKIPTGEKPKQISEMAKKMMRETRNKSQAAFRAGTVRDRFARQTNAAVFNSLTPTAYSPAPMTPAAKAIIKKKAALKSNATTVNPMGLKQMNFDKPRAAKPLLPKKKAR